MEQKPSLVGGACIIAGVCVGAGMLGLPSAGAGAWTLWSMLAVALTMVVMTVSGWMLLESYRGYPLRVSFDTVTRDLLGEKVNALNNLSVYFVGGILLYAGAGVLLTLAAFSNPANVKQLQTKIGELGIKVYTEPLDSPGGKKTRVRAGPFANRDAAEKALEKMKRIGVNGVVAARQ